MPNFKQGPRDPSAPVRSFDGDPDQCCRIQKWGRIKKDLKKVEMPGDGPNGESIAYADFRRNQPVFAVDKTGDGWTHCRFLPEETIMVKQEDGTEVEERRKPSTVFAHAMIPTLHWDPHPDWADGREPATGLPACDEERETDRNLWSRDSNYEGYPMVPQRAVKRTRDPQDTLHTDQAPHYLAFKPGDRVVYGTTGVTGTIIKAAHPMLSSWNILPEHENAAPITLPTRV
jgi:hypothetical protein